MDQKKEGTSKQEDKEENNVSRAQSQDALDSSSASSLSLFADHSEVQNSCPYENEKSSDGQKSGECSPRFPLFLFTLNSLHIFQVLYVLRT